MSAACFRISLSSFPDAIRLSKRLLPVLLVCLAAPSWTRVGTQGGSEEVQDISGEYHFLSADDTLGLLEEEGRLRGYVDVYQGEEESDAILSYPITIGLRKDDHVEFKTGKIHQKYYRFSGRVQRGAGHKDADPDYLRLVGDLEIVTVKAETGQEITDRKHVVFKSLRKSEGKQE